MEEPVTKRFARVPEVRVRVPKFADAEKRFVELAVVEKKFVVVADVPVAEPKLKSVKFPEGPETVEPVRVALVKVPPEVKA